MSAHQQHGSAANLSNRQEHPEHIETVEVESHNVLYSAPQKQFWKSMLNIAMASVAWTGVIMACFMVMLTDQIDLNSSSKTNSIDFRWILPMIMVALLAAVEAGIAIRNRNSLPASRIFTVILLGIYLPLAVLFYGLQIHYQWILATVASVIYIVLGLLFIEQKKLIVYRIILALEVCSIALKIDQVISTEWIFIMILPLLVTVVAFLLAIVILITGIKALCERGQIHATPIGAIYQGLVSLSTGLILGLLCLRILLMDNAFLPALFCAAYHLLFLLLFLYTFREEVILYQSEAQVIGFIEQQKKIQFERVNEETKLYYLSSNWLTQNKQLAKNSNQPENHIDQAENSKQCAICLTDTVSMAWMPCGHLSVCQTCGNYLKQNSKLECIMCKTKCQQIYHLSQNPSPSLNECLSDFHYQVVVK